MKQFISWRRVSTKRQGKSGLGLEAQKNIIDYFVQNEGGELIADYCEVYTGTELANCIELRKAINHAKETDAILIIAKTDRFRNTLEALQVLEEVGEQNIMFCDLPHTDKFTLTLFFAIAEREALLISLRTKAALQAKKERGELTGGACRKEINTKQAIEQSRINRRLKAQNNKHNKEFWEFKQLYEQIHGKLNANSDFQMFADELNKFGKKTSTGLEFTKLRSRAMFYSMQKIFENN